MLTNLIVLIILQHIHASDHHIVHLKLIQRYMPIMSLKLGEKKEAVTQLALGINSGGDLRNQIIRNSIYVIYA